MGLGAPPSDVVHRGASVVSCVFVCIEIAVGCSIHAARALILKCLAPREVVALSPFKVPRFEAVS